MRRDRADDLPRQGPESLLDATAARGLFPRQCPDSFLDAVEDTDERLDQCSNSLRTRAALWERVWPNRQSSGNHNGPWQRCCSRSEEHTSELQSLRHLV